MNNLVKAVLLEAWFFCFFPLLGGAVIFALGWPGVVVCLALFVVWCWQLFVYSHYRYCRQEEFLHVLDMAVATGAPIESVLKVYLRDRPSDLMHRFMVSGLLFFVFPGFYWIHRERRFDARLALVTSLLDNGVPLNEALVEVPGVVSRENALAITVGQFTGRLAQALQHLPYRRYAPLWAELVPRLVYPFLLLTAMLINVVFMVIFIIPKFEHLFGDMHLGNLPGSTTMLIEASKWIAFLPLAWLLVLLAVNAILFSSRLKWYLPGLGRLYRLHARGLVLQVLGTMLESGKPLPMILDCVLASGLLPRVLETRVEGLAAQVEEGGPLLDGLTKQGLVTRAMCPLILAAEKAHNLPWALQQLGETLGQRCARATYRLTMLVFPLAIFGCACLIGFVAVSMFMPLIQMLEKYNA
jgi:general secretion pathway protein F